MASFLKALFTFSEIEFAFVMCPLNKVKLIWGMLEFGVNAEICCFSSRNALEDFFCPFVTEVVRSVLIVSKDYG